MKCCSRSTLGVVIGSINILCYIVSAIIMIVGMVLLNVAAKEAEKSQKESYHSFNQILNHNAKQYDMMLAYIMAFGTTVLAISLVLCLIMTLISILLVMGIVKRRHTFMAPWLILTGIGFVLNCINVVVVFFRTVSSGAGFGTAFLNFMGGCLVICIQGLILYPIYTLYNDIRAKQNTLVQRY